jgi:hypothetical protein
MFSVTPHFSGPQNTQFPSQEVTLQDVKDRLTQPLSHCYRRHLSQLAAENSRHRTTICAFVRLPSTTSKATKLFWSSKRKE